MNFDKLAALCEELSYRDKLRLAQLMIQMARKEEEEGNPQNRMSKNHEIISSSKPMPVKTPTAAITQEKPTIEYVAERILKLKPSKRASLLNSIGAMFQFQGGISDEDKDKIIAKLINMKVISFENNKVIY